MNTLIKTMNGEINNRSWTSGQGIITGINRDSS